MEVEGLKRPLSLAEFSSIRQRKLSAAKAAQAAADFEKETQGGEAAAQSRGGAGGHDQEHFAWVNSRGFVQLTLLGVVYDILLLAAGQALALQDLRTKSRSPVLAAASDGLEVTAYLGAIVAAASTLAIIGHCLRNLRPPRLLQLADVLCSAGFVVAGFVLGMREARLLAVLRLANIYTLMHTVQSECEAEASHWRSVAEVAERRAASATSQADQATTKWTHETSTRQRAELHVQQYKEEALMLKEALYIASQDMAALQERLQGGRAKAGASPPDASTAPEDAQTSALLEEFLADVGLASGALSPAAQAEVLGVLFEEATGRVRERLASVLAESGAASGVGGTVSSEGGALQLPSGASVGSASTRSGRRGVTGRAVVRMDGAFKVLQKAT